MRLFLFLLFPALALAAGKTKDLSQERVAQGYCGTLASAMTERVHNTNKEMKKEYYKTPVFDGKADFEMMRALKSLASQSASFTKDTPDSRRMAPLLAAFDELKRRNFRFVRKCLSVYRPAAKACYSRYQKENKDALDTCLREKVDKSDEAALVKEFFLKAK